jgi:hypothetical protein
MIRIEALRYYTVKKHWKPLEAQRIVDEYREKHPDREYVLLVNTRAWESYLVAQVERVTVEVPEPEDLMMPARPDPVGIGAHQADLWDRELKRRRGDFETKLTGKMNP